MLPIPVMEIFDKGLLEVPELTRLIDQYPTRLLGAVAVWLAHMITQAEQYALPFATELSLIRARLLSPSSDKGNIRQNRREQIQHAIDALEQARVEIRTYFKMQHIAYDECLSLCMQAIAVAQANGLLQGSTLTAEDVIARMKTDNALLPAVTKIIGTVGKINTQVLFNRVIPQLETICMEEKNE